MSSESSVTPTTWSIDELARVAGVPTRTIREYRTQGVLAPPVKVGRVGVYDEGHRRRLELIGRLQSRGYSLAGIRDLFAAWDSGQSLHDLLDGVAIDEAPVAYTNEQLIVRVAPLHDPEARAAALAAGLLTSGPDDLWYVRSPSLLVLVADLCELGVDFGVVLGVVATLVRQTEAHASVLADLFVEEVWSNRETRDVLAFARRARPLLAQAVVALSADALAREIRRRSEATNDPQLAAMIDDVSVGAVVLGPPATPRK